MADPIINVERSKVEAKIKSLTEQLKKQIPHDVAQYIRGQILVWEAVEHWDEPKTTRIVPRDPDKPTIPLY